MGSVMTRAEQIFKAGADYNYSLPGWIDLHKVRADAFTAGANWADNNSPEILVKLPREEIDAIWDAQKLRRMLEIAETALRHYVGETKLTRPYGWLRSTQGPEYLEINIGVWAEDALAKIQEMKDLK
jgi:hypothetical protein